MPSINFETIETQSITDINCAIDFIVKNDVLQNCVKLFRQTFTHFELNRKIDFSTKVDGSLVSSLELEIEKEISAYLQKSTPWAAFQGEEGTTHEAKIASCFKWFLDPIDGTISFRNGLDTFAFTLTLVDSSGGVATIIDFPRLGKTFTALKNRGAQMNGAKIEVKKEHFPHAVFAISDDYTYQMANRLKIRDTLRNLPFIIRTVTDIYGYSLVAEGKCIGKFDAAGALWDLWPGHLLITEAGGKCLFLPVENPTDDLTGSMLIGSEETVNYVWEHLKKNLDQACLPTPNHFQGL